MSKMQRYPQHLPSNSMTACEHRNRLNNRHMGEFHLTNRVSFADIWCEPDVAVPVMVLDVPLGMLGVELTVAQLI